MFAYIRAIFATLLVLEISGAFAIGSATILLLMMHVSGIAFWSVEALMSAAVLYVCALFFMRAIKFEKSADAATI